MATLVDSYNSPEFNTSFTNGNTMWAQSFTATGGVLHSAQFYLSKNGTPPGNIFVYIYAHTGTYGTSSKPTGAILATSDAIAGSSLPASPSAGYVTFTFSGAEKITLTNGVNYCLAIRGPSITGVPDYIDVLADATSPTHGGNAASSSDAGANWNPFSGRDFAFAVYKDDAASPNTGFLALM